MDRLRPVRRHRHVWSRPGRAHIEVHGIREPGCERLCEDVERGLARVGGVHWAQVNYVLGRVVVSFDPDGATVADLVGIVEGVEEAHRASDEPFPADRPEHPADLEPLRRNAIALGADAAALGASFAGQLLRLAPLPTELASVVSFLDNEPHVRRLLERHLGRGAADLGLGLASAVAQAIAQGPLSLTVDMAHRANLIGELVARRRCWERFEPALHSGPSDERSGPLRSAERPVPLPPGIGDRYADRAALASLGAFGAALALTRSPRRSAALLIAGLPKAARQGRAAYGAQLGRELARRDVLVLDGTALDRLDRVDTVVLDAGVVRTAPSIGPARALVESARACRLRVLVAGGGRPLAARLGAHDALPGGRRLASSVHQLQREGAVVLLVTGGGDDQALLAADVAVGVLGGPGAPPWASDLLVGCGLDGARLVVHGVAGAVTISRHSTFVALAGSAAGGLWSFAGPAMTASSRASLPTNLASLAAQTDGAVAARRIARRGLPPGSDPGPAGGVPSGGHGDARDAMGAAEAEWHAMAPGAVLDALGSARTGLDEAEAASRRAGRGAEPSGLARAARALRSELANPLTPLLAAGAGLSAAVGSVGDAALVAGVTAANALIGAAQRLRADVSIAKLAQVSDAVVDVLREGERTPVDRAAVVPGDVVALDPGDVVPADCRVLWAAGCEVDESAVTGESMPVAKHASPTPGAPLAERSSMLYEGTTVSSGSVLAVVVAVGDATEMGRSLSAAGEPPATGVEARLSSLTAAILPATVLSGGTVTALGVLRGRSPRRAVSSGVGLTVAAVPEGLPLLATTAQQAAARRLATRGAMVRNPRTIEALGRVDTLCFDKTGTLTLGEIRLQCVSDGTGDDEVGSLTPRTRAVLAAAVRACPRIDGEGDVGSLAHPTDRAVMAGAADGGVSTGGGTWRVVGELAFDPARGFHAVLGETPGGMVLSVKGAPEMLLERCTSWRGPRGDVPLERAPRRRLHQRVEDLASRGLRVLAVAERPVAGRHRLGEASIEELTLLGFVALADSVRPEAAAAVGDLRDAGVGVVMITGDHPRTAAAVGRKLGILNGHQVLAGADLDRMSDEELDGVLPDVSVFARVTPTDKVRIVRAYQRLGRVVAMTGDGANDAPAIRLAHVGIALGSRSTAPAREAADLVVVDDRMETILDALYEGRAMWVSVRDALAILVGGNLGEVAFSVTATAIAGASPLEARQFLLVNLMTDMVPAMVVALRPPRRGAAADLLAEGPDRSLGSALAAQIGLRAAATAGGTTAAWLAARATGRRRRASTVALAALVATQLGQTAVVGRDSPLVVASVAVSAAALVAVVQTPGISQFFGCTPLGPIGWSIALGSAAAATGASAVVPALLRSVSAPGPPALHARAARDVPGRGPRAGG